MSENLEATVVCYELFFIVGFDLFFLSSLVCGRHFSLLGILLYLFWSFVRIAESLRPLLQVYPV
jgi:hypothetical protein